MRPFIIVALLFFSTHAFSGYEIKVPNFKIRLQTADGVPIPFAKFEVHAAFMEWGFEVNLGPAIGLGKVLKQGWFLKKEGIERFVTNRQGEIPVTSRFYKSFMPHKKDVSFRILYLGLYSHKDKRWSPRYLGSPNCDDLNISVQTGKPFETVYIRNKNVANLEEDGLLDCTLK